MSTRNQCIDARIFHQLKHTTVKLELENDEIVWGRTAEVSTLNPGDYCAPCAVLLLQSAQRTLCAPDSLCNSEAPLDMV